MPEAVRVDEAEQHGRTLVVRYREDPGQPDHVLVDITARDTEGDHHSRIDRAEIGFVIVTTPMSWDAVRARVAAEAERRAIERVAWIREF